MTRDELLAALREAMACGDPEDAHVMADDALLGFINDEEVSALYDAVDKWYA